LVLVLSNVANEAADQLVEMFPPGAASLITASNLHVSFKIAVSVGNLAASELTIGGVRISPADVSGVISTIENFFPQEFYYIEPADRAYVCAEVSAFFVYFLTELQCKKLNPPSPRSLSGLGMHRIEWMAAASGLGIPVWPADLKNGIPVEPAAHEQVESLRATIVGDAVVEAVVPEKIRTYLYALSRAFSLPYLCADFIARGDGEYFLDGLASVPDITLPANREAIVAFMKSAT
jgi:hypothetical protein